MPRIRIRTQPASSKDQIVGIHDGTIKIKITAAAVDGKANQHLIKFLAKKLGVSKQSIRIIRGETARTKLIEISDTTSEQIRDKLLTGTSDDLDNILEP